MFSATANRFVDSFTENINSSNIADNADELILGLPSTSTSSFPELSISTIDVSRSASGRPKRQASSRISDFVAAEAELRKYPLGYPKSGRFDVGKQVEKSPIRDQMLVDLGLGFVPGHADKTVAAHVGDSYPCCYCDNAFQKLEQLEQHILTHVKPLPHVCAVCKHSFSARQTLLVHMASHLSQRRFACSICPMAFTQKGKLKLHLRTHSGERPYKCSYEGCKYAAAQKGNLNVHLRSVHGEL